MESSAGRAGGGGGGGGSWVLVEALLQGGAPWGFTLQGGLEHGEPLIISKVEEGGKADSLDQPLLVGDEIVVINEVELTGYRQEAIALVKGSYKTLQLTVRRELDPGYIEEFDTPCSSPPALPPPSPPPLSSHPRPSTPQQRQQTASPSPSHHSRACSAGGVQLRIKNRHREPASRPHSWHSTKLGDVQQDLDQGGMDTMSSAWHHGYHASASTTDLSGGFDSGGGYLRKSPDQYSSRGSMESLDPPQSSHLHSGAQQHHHHTNSGPHPAYSSCQQLSSARSSNSIDHLHNKRDSAYSSFSNSSSIPDYLASTPSFSPERSYSLETVPQRGGGSGELQQADMRYVRTVYDAQQGLSQEHELGSSSAALLRSSDSRGSGGTRAGPSRDVQASVGGVCYRVSSSGSSSGGAPASNRHSVGPIWVPATSRSSYESLKGAPAPPRRSDSYAAIRNHERPNSWSSLDHARSLRSLQKGSWHHSSGPVASGAAKGLYSAEGQLHTVIEKSPESSPTTKPRQGGGFPQPPSPTGPAPQSGRLILPTGMYPVPQPEPQFAQMPSTSPGPASSGVYPALTKENSRQQHQGLEGAGRRHDAVTDGQSERRMSATENGYQNSTSSSPYPYSSSQFRALPHEDIRPQKEESYYEHNKPNPLTAGGGSKSQPGAKRPQNHQGHNSQGFQESHIHPSQGSHGQVFQEPHKEFYIPNIQSTQQEVRPSSSQDWREPSSSVHLRGERSRSMDQTSIPSEPVASPKLAQGQVPPTPLPVHPQPQPQAPTTPASHPSPRHLSDSAALQYHHHWEQDKDREHPLTRLEIALAEVQRCTTPDSVFSVSSHGNSNFGEDSQGPTRSLSVLEKVSRFERRERAGKQRSQSTTTPHRASPLRLSEKGRSTACGAEDLRNMLERSSSKAHRTMSYRGGSNEQMKQRTPTDPNAALQRSRSSFHLNESREGNSSRDLPWRQEIHQLMGSVQDTSPNRSYRDSLIDAQSKVLRSTSFRRRDLSSSISPPPPAASPPMLSSSSHQPSPVSAKFQSPEKKGPKTMPKPQGVIIPTQSSPPITSPHTPKERYVVSPDVRGPSPPPLPSVPPVGPPALLRICGRKRLAADQKKRSYSEPENMNEVGVSDPETTALFRRGGETSVADRRKMFEQNASSRTDLRQLQHDALAEYIQRKRGGKRDKGGQKSGQRPRSAFLQAENSHPPVSSCHSDTLSLSSASSLLSLQESSFSSEGRSLCSSVPPGTDLRSLQSNLFYPGRVTSPRPPAHPPPGGSPPRLQAQSLQDLTPESGFSRQSQSSLRDLARIHQNQTTEPQVNLGLSKQLNGALQRAGSARGSGKSASAEDLLERTEEKPVSPQHYRSRSSPIVERLNQDLPPGDVGVFDVFISEPRRCSLAADRSISPVITPSDNARENVFHRPTDIQISEGLVSAQQSNNLNTVQPAGPFKDPGFSHTPVTRRERQRNGERQRANSTSTLAASVGLPCPFSPPGPKDGGSTEWHANERLSQANLDSITFPGLTQTDTEDAVTSPSYNETSAMDRQMRHSLGDASNLDDTTKDVYRERTFSLDMRRGQSAENASVTSTLVTDFQTPAPPNKRENTPSPPLSYQQRLSSLRISESNLISSPTEWHPPLKAGLSQEEYDEVFLQNPKNPLKETTIEDDFPPPPPPVELEQEVEQTQERKSSLPSPPTSPSSTAFPPPVLSHLPTPKPTSITPITTSTPSEESFGLEYQPLPKREKTSEEQRVEELARQLMLQDGSLVPLLDTWGGKSTVELMEDIFPNSKVGGKSPWQRRGSSRLDERIQDGVCDLTQSTTTDGRKETNLDEEEKDLNTRKVELCEALRSSVAALRREKEALSEEQRRHQSLGASIETLVQEHLKPNERDKYSMFIGDLDRIVNLLLSLCSRLSRIDRSLLALERDDLTQEGVAEERDSLHHKRSLLLCQTEDARELKENLDRRQRVVHAILSGYLTDPQLQDYRHFVSTKPSLLIHQRQLDDLIRQGEEQLTRLAESLPQEVAEAHGWSRGFPFLSSSPAHCSSPIPTLLPPSATPAHSVRSTTVTSL
ncbi:protein Shroom3 isoform X2 [Cheilinus undulatus]|uniref:protein Shroom3 isoform X2 n=1 Tax=Cheilinus undulatus TaxID=241271 RepID=UPI001BD5469B|nr:protein Shroom3 isoform X2 [Cheilinus undulatus]